MSQKTLPLIENGVIDLIRLADIYQRGLFAENQRMIIEKINLAAYGFLKNTADFTSLEASSALLKTQKQKQVTQSFRANDQAATKKRNMQRALAKVLGEIQDLVKPLNVQTVVLPMCEGSLNGKLIEGVFTDHMYKHPFKLRENPYDIDLSLDGAVLHSLKDNHMLYDVRRNPRLFTDHTAPAIDRKILERWGASAPRAVPMTQREIKNAYGSGYFPASR